MSFRLKPHEPAAEDVRRVALRRLDKAREALARPRAQRDEAVHDARKRFKELRALLRLIREPLGKHYAPQNRRLRDAGRALSDLRDVAALVESWDALAKDQPERFASEPLRQARARLAERNQAFGADSEAADTVLNEVGRALDEAETAVHDWSLKRDGFGLYATGLRASYKRGRKALAQAQETPSDEHLHEWRKRVKDQWYHTRLLQDAWPALLKRRVRMLDTLSDWLGDDHDLAMLQALLRDEPNLFGGEDTQALLGELIVDRRQALQAEAFQLGRRLYAESPAALAKRWQRYWKLTQAERSEDSKAAQ